MSYMSQKNVPPGALQQVLARWFPALAMLAAGSFALTLWLSMHAATGQHRFNVVFGFFACAVLLAFFNVAFRAAVRLPYRFLVGGGACAILLLMVAMHCISPVSVGVHPDEALHVASLSYFLGHAMPPAANDPALVPVLTSSVWGITYLNEYDVVYFIAGHMVGPFVALLGTPMGWARIFQMLLWAVLVVCALHKERWAIVLAPLLISAQTWYMFSYFNGDAFPLCLSMLATVLASDYRGGVDAFLAEGRRIGPGVLALAVCLGLLLVSKANYALVVFGLFLFLGVRLLDLTWLELVTALGAAGAMGVAAFLGKWPVASPLYSRTTFLLIGVVCSLAFAANLAWRCRKDRPVLGRFLRFAILGLLVLVVAAPRVIDDLWINGMPAHKAKVVAAVTEQYAQHDFKPSVFMSGEGRANLRLAQKGKPLDGMLHDMSWYTTTFGSAFGVYAHMSVWADPSVYDMLYWLLAIMALLSMVAQVRVHASEGAKTIVLVLGGCGLVLISSILYSWLVDFEPQGRYLMPMLPFVSLLFAPAFRAPGKTVMKLLLIAMMLISAYSYTYVGMVGVQKIEIERATAH
ncbi:MAG TPA: hypothetical protein VGV14_15100 [Rhodanobacter sp.]|nr:hypothetical protein [Rhodanobacter sp.]